MTTNSPQSRLDPAAKKSLPASDRTSAPGVFKEGEFVGEYVEGMFVHASGPLPTAVKEGVKKLLRPREKNTSKATKLESTTGDDASSELEMYFFVD